MKLAELQIETQNEKPTKLVFEDKLDVVKASSL